MKKRSKKRCESSESTSSSAGSPSPQRRPPDPDRSKSAAGQQVTVAKKLNPTKSKVIPVLQPKTRTSPRRGSTATEPVQGTSSGSDRDRDVKNILPVGEQKPSMSTFRIPKVKAIENPKKVKPDPLPLESESKLSKSNVVNSPSIKLRIKTDMRPRVLTHRRQDHGPVGPSSSTSTDGCKHQGKKHVKDGEILKSSKDVPLNKIPSTDTNTVLSQVQRNILTPTRTLSTDKARSASDTDITKEFRSVPKPLEPEGLQVRRKLESISGVRFTNKITLEPRTVETFLNSNEKNRTKTQADHSPYPSKVQTYTKIFPDLPDYVGSGSEGEEEMEWENPVPQILKMVKEASNVTENLEGASLSNIGMGGEQMDVDPDPAEQLVIVPDTNIWIGNLDLIKELLELDEKFSRVSQPTIIIPWMVLQELDVGLHKANLDKEKARQPVNFIYSLLSNKHPRVKGQKASEAAISKLKFDEIMADDSILNCVFQMQKNNNIVVFLTNDRNLLNKALVHDVLACDSQSVLQKINGILSKFTTAGSSSDILESSSRAVTLPTSNSIGFGPSLRTGMKRKPDGFIHLPVLPCIEGNNMCIYPFKNTDLIMEPDDDPMTGCVGPAPPKIEALGQDFPLCSGTESSEIFEALRLAFSHIICWKMVDDYGMGGWEYALKFKPPWTLKTSIKCMIAHWIANFSFVFSRKGQSHLEKLGVLVDDYKSASKINRVEIEKSVVETALGLFNLANTALINEAPVLKCRQLLMDYAICNRN